MTKSEKAHQAKVAPKSGDYVLATKWSDGDPSDGWAIGFYDREDLGRHYVVDGNGQQFRANGFRRVEVISADRGRLILKNVEAVNLAERSLWWWKRRRVDE